MTLAISIIAIVISLASLAFNLYQFKNTKKLRRLEKCNEVLHRAFLLRKLSQDLRNKISVTDDIDDYDHVLDPLDMAIESQFAKLLENTDVPLQDIFALETKLLSLDLEFDLLSKQIDIQIDFNNQVKAVTANVAVNTDATR